MTINILNLKKYYEKNLTLHIPKLEITNGNRVGILGKNGCGKTTLISMIVGVENISQGEIIIDNMTHNDNW